MPRARPLRLLRVRLAALGGSPLSRGEAGPPVIEPLPRALERAASNLASSPASGPPSRQSDAFLASMGLSPQSFRALLGRAHQIMRDEAEAERQA